jgi:hypothetical protein
MVICKFWATLDKFSLPQDGMWKRKNKVTPLGEGAYGPYVGNMDEATCSQFQSKPRTGEDTAMLVRARN